MKLKIDIDSHGIRQALENRAKERVRNAASKIADEMTKEAKSVMYDFYSWKPRMYKRQPAVADPSVCQRYYRNPHNTIYYAGVEILQSKGSYRALFSKGHPSVGGEYITDLMMQGRHGATETFPSWVLAHVSNYPPIMRPTPEERLIRKLDEIGGNMEKYFN